MSRPDGVDRFIAISYELTGSDLPLKYRPFDCKAKHEWVQQEDGYFCAECKGFVPLELAQEWVLEEPTKFATVLDEAHWMTGFKKKESSSPAHSTEQEPGLFYFQGTERVEVESPQELERLAGQHQMGEHGRALLQQLRAHQAQHDQQQQRTIQQQARESQLIDQQIQQWVMQAAEQLQATQPQPRRRHAWIRSSTDAAYVCRRCNYQISECALEAWSFLGSHGNERNLDERLDNIAFSDHRTCVRR